eukprot:8188946-Alexandrium_andersonii.AAC.1
MREATRTKPGWRFPVPSKSQRCIASVRFAVAALDTVHPPPGCSHCCSIQDQSPAVRSGRGQERCKLPGICQWRTGC